jgi:antitoxin MazE
VRIGQLGDSAVPVRFAQSGVTLQWSHDSGSLLELAEAVGLAPVFGCRSGICGTSATGIISGAVDDVEEPLAPCGDGQVLLCCCAARSPPRPPHQAAPIPVSCSTFSRNRPGTGDKSAWCDPLIFRSLWDILHSTSISMEKLMQVAKWGNSLAVRLPASVVDALELKEGDEIEIYIADERLFGVTRKPTREELLKRLRAFRGRLPADFKFERDEANAR